MITLLGMNRKDRTDVNIMVIGGGGYWRYWWQSVR